MAIQENGPNGLFKGKVGSIYAYELNGKNIIRGSRRKSNKPPSEAMLMNWQKMKVASTFAKEMVELLKYGYRNLSPKGSRIGAFQMAQRHILKDTMELDADCQYYVNVEKLFIFRGPLSSPSGCSVSRKGNILHLKWTVMPEYNTNFYKINFGLFNLDGLLQLEIGAAEVHRGACTVTLNSHAENGAPIHIYFGIWNSFNDLNSDSVYCGIVE